MKTTICSHHKLYLYFLKNVHYIQTIVKTNPSAKKLIMSQRRLFTKLEVYYTVFLELLDIKYPNGSALI